MSDDPVAIAEEAGLRYTTDIRPGIGRKRAGKGFTYVASNGTRVTDPRTLNRIKGLVIPPAWTDVWISPSANGHLQATGRDAKGRKQSIYHPDWRTFRDTLKFDRMHDFGLALPKIRAQVSRDLRSAGTTKQKIVAVVVRLLETTLIRVGNRAYAEANDSHGLTTLYNDHIEVHADTIRFQFRGKSGKFHDLEHRDRRLAKVVRQCQELPGQSLFKYEDADGVAHDVTSADVNAYIHEASGGDFTAKDFRTWGATLETLRLLRESDPEQRNIPAIVKMVAASLGNTPAVARSSYIHPRLLEPWDTRPVWETVRLPAPKPGGLLPLEQILVKHVLS